MLTSSCINPGLIRVLALCGHGDKVLIADGNYPLASKSGGAEKVFLGLMPGLPTVTDVLSALQSATHFESCQVMDPGDGTRPALFDVFSRQLGGMEPEKLSRAAFYDACGNPAVRLAISTGETRVFANLLLTVGVA